MGRANRVRWGLAIALAVLGAFWFEVDFSSSQQALGDAALIAGGATAGPQHPLPSLSALGSALTGGVVTSVPPWGVLSVALAYLLGRLTFKRWSKQR